MSRPIAITLALVGLLLLMLVGSRHVLSAVEADLTKRAEQELNRVGLSNLRVVSDGQELRLVGTLASNGQRDLAVRSTRQVWGVTAVHQQLQVSAVTAVDEPSQPLVHAIPITTETAASAKPVVTAQNCQRELTTLVRSEPIGFGFGQADIDAASHALLAQLATTLVRCPYAVEVGGHTDATGSVQANQWMSEQRALAVSSFLRESVAQQLGAQDGPRFTARGYGSQRPTATNDTRAGRRLNRRIEFTLSEDAE